MLLLRLTINPMTYGGKAREKCDSQVNELALANCGSQERLGTQVGLIARLSLTLVRESGSANCPVPFTRIQLGVLGSEAILGHIGGSAVCIKSRRQGCSY